MSYEEDGNMTYEEFKRILESMANYHSIHSHSYAMPASVSFLAVSNQAGLGVTVSQDAQEELKKANESIKSEIYQYNNSEPKELQKISENKLNGSISDADWSKLIEDRRKQAIERSKQIITNYYNTVKEIGNKYPANRGIILQTASKVVDFVLGLFEKVGEFIMKLAHKIYEWLKTAYDIISSFFADTFKVVEHFFEAYA